MNTYRRVKSYQNYLKKYMHEYYLKHKKVLLNRFKKYRIKNKFKIQEYRRKNAEIFKKYIKQYRQVHKKEISKQINNKRKVNLSYRLAQNLRLRIWHAIKNNIKSANTIKLLGCSIEFLKNHLESQFKSGMKWSNYGLIWEIDHIKPCCSFDLSKASEQRSCFNYTNLQPLFVEENRRKNRF